ncbi:MAG: recombinase family protein [Arenicella sp.]
MKKLYGYVRVSTTKQGDGVSLIEQKRAIQEFAKKEGYTIIKFFEEKVTAAKEGRAEFNEMVKQLYKKKADGVVMHKVDRSSRNFGDWHKIGKLVDSGINVFYAHSNTDLSKRGDRLTADIELVMAADYIRNLRSEVKKGFYGRLKQGLLPLPAPVGYLDTGAGNAKAIDPEKAPLIKKAFELYSTGDYGLKELSKEMYKRGMTSKVGKRISFQNWSKILNNPFYFGMIRVNKTNETFKGIHQPIISSALFNRVKLVLEGKTPRRVIVHDFAFRRFVKCSQCNYSIIGEIKKGKTYYRCHTKNCPTKSIREDRLSRQLVSFLKYLSLTKLELEQTQETAKLIIKNSSHESNQLKQNIRLNIGDTKSKLDCLTDNLISGVVDEETYKRKKEELNLKLLEKESQLRALENENIETSNYVEDFLGRLKSLCINKKPPSGHILRRLVFCATSDLFLNDKSVAVQPFLAFRELLKVRKLNLSPPLQREARESGMKNCPKGGDLIYLKDLEGVKVKPLTKKQQTAFAQAIVNHCIEQ